MAVFELVTPLMGFAHLGLVARPGESDQLKADIRSLNEAALVAASRALPSRDGPKPLGVHVELDDERVRAAVCRSGPDLLNVRIYAESDRAAVAHQGIASILPMVDLDDYGEVLHVYLSEESEAQLLAASAFEGELQAWLKRMASAT